MKNFKIILVIFLIQNVGFAQYGGYGGGGYGGYGGGAGYGRMGGGGMSQQQFPTTPYKQTPKDHAKIETKWLKKNLNLTDDQEAIMLEITEDYAEQKANLINSEFKAGEQPSAEKINEVRPKLQELDRRKEEEFKRLLKPDQWDTYLLKKKEEQDKRDLEKAKNKGKGF